MELVNGTRFSLDVTQSLDKDGRMWVVAIAKATYAFPCAGDHAARLAPRQTGLLVSDVFEAEAGLSTPHFESDLAPFKRLCDVVVKGTAHAPSDKAVRELIARVKVGAIDKAVRVVGERSWVSRAGRYRPGDPAPFTAIPVTYGRAFGGMWDGRDFGDAEDFVVYAANPIGRGYAPGRYRKLLEGARTPNVEAIDDPIRDPEGGHTPVSFGPVARNWTPRRNYAGTYDAEWRDSIYPLLPPNFDDRFYQCAPDDQQIPYPRGAELVNLWNLTTNGHVEFRLPALDLPMVVVLRDRSQVVLSPVVDTLAIDADAELFDVVWRARLPVRRGLVDLRLVAAGSVCKRWWRSQLYGSGDCGCGGFEVDDKDLLSVTEMV